MVKSTKIEVTNFRQSLIDKFGTVVQLTQPKINTIISAIRVDVIIE